MRQVSSIAPPLKRHHNANKFVKIFFLRLWHHWFYDRCFSSVVVRLLLFVDEADAFLRKRNQVKKSEQVRFILFLNFVGWYLLEDFYLNL